MSHCAAGILKFLEQAKPKKTLNKLIDKKLFVNLIRNEGSLKAIIL